MTSIGRLPEKERRRARRTRKNNIAAKELGDRKYHQRVVPGKSKRKPDSKYKLDKRDYPLD